MDSSSLELSLGLKPYPYVPKSIPNLLKHLSETKNVPERLLVLNHYLQQLEEELSKVEALKVQLPHCMLFLMDGIKTLKKEALNIENGLRSEYIMPIVEDSLSKRRYEDEQRETDGKRFGKEKNDKMSTCSSSCSQLCKLGHYKTQKTSLNSTQPWKFRSGGGAIIAESSSMEVTNECGNEVARVSGHGGLNLSANDQHLDFQSEPLAQPIWKKNRRSWTPELHARFVEALEYLGGSNVATPKQIREIMQVEGLTNDQVKSHLQKYRLHGRRLPEDGEDLAEGSQNSQ